MAASGRSPAADCLHISLNKVENQHCKQSLQEYRGQRNLSKVTNTYYFAIISAIYDTSLLLWRDWATTVATSIRDTFPKLAPDFLRQRPGLPVLRLVPDPLSKAFLYSFPLE